MQVSTLAYAAVKFFPLLHMVKQNLLHMVKQNGEAKTYFTWWGYGLLHMLSVPIISCPIPEGPSP